MIRAITVADDDRLDDVEADLLISQGDLWDNTIEMAFARYGCAKASGVKGNHDSDIFPSSITIRYSTLANLFRPDCRVAIDEC